MDSKERQICARTIAFAQHLFLPSLEKLSAPEGDSGAYSAEFHRASLLEAILLLDLGVELQYFGTDYAQQLIDRIDPRVLRELDEFLAQWGHLFSSDNVPVFAGPLTDGIRFDRLHGHYTEFAHLDVAFRNLLVDAVQIASDLLCGSMTQFACFERSDEQWRLGLNRVHEANSLSDYLNGNVSPGPNEITQSILVAGFFRMLEYINATQQSWAALVASLQYTPDAIGHLMSDLTRRFGD